MSFQECYRIFFNKSVFQEKHQFTSTTYNEPTVANNELKFYPRNTENQQDIGIMNSPHERSVHNATQLLFNGSLIV